MTYKITGFEPASLFRFFEDISAIPRGSYHEKALSDFLVEFAKARGLWYHQDELLSCCKDILIWSAKSLQRLRMILKRTVLT